MKSYKVYYINLDKSVERKNFMEEQFKSLNIPITRMPAIYGKEIEKNLLKKLKSNHNILAHFPFPNDGEVGLTMTYFKLWDIISKQEEDFSIILEDDAFVNEYFFKDLDRLLEEITTNDFLDISGKKGFISLEKNELIIKFLIPPLLTTGQIIGKNAAKKLSENLETYYAPIDVMKQDVYKHKVKLYSTNKQYVYSNDKNVGGTTIQKKNMPIYKKIIREAIRPFWQLISLFSFKLYRCVRNYSFYKTNTL